MKRCPECRRDYFDDSLLYCLDDGAALLEGPGSLLPDVRPSGEISPSDAPISDNPRETVLIWPLLG
jgi:hypothetical protein